MIEHSWRKHEREGWTVCTVCGAVRNYDRPESSCRGAVKIALREATGGEQGETAEMLEIVRLRCELDGARADTHRHLVALSDLRSQLWRARDERDEALARLRDRLSTIVDEAFGPQEVLGVDALLSRLEHLLTERARQHEEVRRELDEALARISALEKVAMDCASQCDHCDPAIRIERLSEALRDLVGSVEKLEPTRLDFTIVRQCVKAALTVLGGQS